MPLSVPMADHASASAMPIHAPPPVPMLEAHADAHGMQNACGYAAAHVTCPRPLHRINEADVYKTTTRAKDTIFSKSYPVAWGIHIKLLSIIHVIDNISSNNMNDSSVH